MFAVRPARIAVEVAALGGCALMFACQSVGPDFEWPEVPWLQSWPGTGLSKVIQPAAQTQTDEWWYNFNDPILDQLIADAKQIFWDAIGEMSCFPACSREVDKRSGCDRDQAMKTISAWSQKEGQHG